MSVSVLKRMKEMESELSQLKRMYANLALENRAMLATELLGRPSSH